MTMKQILDGTMLLQAVIPSGARLTNITTLSPKIIAEIRQLHKKKQNTIDIQNIECVDRRSDHISFTNEVLNLIVFKMKRIHT